MIASSRLMCALALGLVWDNLCVAFQADQLRLLPCASAQASGEWSARVEGWSSDRLGSDDKGLVNIEGWARGRIDIAPTISVRGEGWLASDPRGQGKEDADLREGYAEVRFGETKLRAGRQLLIWGRADRINPTDLLAARDYRRLVSEEDENRLGQATISLSLPVLGGTLGGYWLPEFRSSELPTDPLPGGIALVRRQPEHRDSFAFRYEKFGSHLDLALTLARAPDRTPWLASDPALGPVALVTRYPTVWMAGGDLDATLGKFTVRVEAARYWHDRKELTGITNRFPRFAAVIGIDRNLPGEWMIIAQGLLRDNADAGPVPAPLAVLAARNATIHGAWRQTVVGATLSVRKNFAGNSGKAELTGAWLSGGGAFVQARANYKINDTIRLQFLGEQHFGSDVSYFGRLRANNVVMLGLAAGF